MLHDGTLGPGHLRTLRAAGTGQGEGRRGGADVATGGGANFFLWAFFVCFSVVAAVAFFVFVWGLSTDFLPADFPIALAIELDPPVFITPSRLLLPVHAIILTSQNGPKVKPLVLFL